MAKKTRQQIAAGKAWKTIRSRKAKGMGTLKEARVFCRLKGHTFVDRVCTRCHTKQPDDPRTFVRLAFMEDWKRSMRDLWRGVAVEMMRATAREAAILLMDADEEPDFRDDDVRRAWWPMVEMAMVQHKLTHPRSRGDNPWLFGPERPVKGCNDVLCRFCRKVLLPLRELGFDYTIDTAQHTVPCAVSTLATGASADPRAKKGK